MMHACTNWSASRLAVKLRRAYFEAVLAQDMKYFDNIVPGVASNVVSEKISDYEAAMGNKFAEIFQSLASVIFGFLVAGYYSIKLTGVLIGTVPILGIATMVAIKYGSPDQIGAKAYE